MYKPLFFLPILALAACALKDAKPDPAIEAASRLPLDLCAIKDIEEPLLCGTYSALANWGEPGGSRIDISVLVIPAANGNPDGLAWAEHQGGPGRALLPAARFFTNTEAGRRYRANRDIVLVDQRGVGESGGLYCEALLDLPILEPYYTAEKVSACRREMEDLGVDLRNYSTLASVDDLEAIRKWLGYAQFDVGGWSYGSRYMLTYAQRYPDSIRTLMVALPTPFDYRRPLDWARFGEASLQGLFDDCAATPRCNLVFPGLRADFAALLDKLEREPVPVEFFNPVTQKQTSAQIDRTRFVEEVHVALLSTKSSRLLPLVIHEAARGNFEPFVFLAVPENAPRPISEAQYLSIVCPEETALYTAEEAEASSLNTFTGMYFVDEFKMACREWALPPHQDYPLKWRALDIPTLVISGDRDPITPDEYGERISKSMNNVRHLKVPFMTHNFTGLRGSECLDEVLLQLLETASPETLDTGCLEAMYPPPFNTEIPD